MGRVGNLAAKKTVKKKKQNKFEKAGNMPAFFYCKKCTLCNTNTSCRKARLLYGVWDIDSLLFFRWKRNRHCVKFR